MEMHNAEYVLVGFGRTAVPDGWLYSLQSEEGYTFVPDDLADHVIAYRREQAAKHGLALPAYLRPLHDPHDVGAIADLAVALELDPKAGFNAILSRAVDVVALLKRAEAGAGAGEEVES